MVVVNNSRGKSIMTSIDETPTTYLFDLTDENHKSLVDTDSKMKYLMENESVRWSEISKRVPEHALRVFKVLLRGMLEGRVSSSIYVIVEDEFLVFMHPPVTQAGELKYRDKSDDDILDYVCALTNMNRNLYYSSSEDESLEDDDSDSESEEEDLSSDEELNLDAFMKALTGLRHDDSDDDSQSDEK